ncbi:MAG: UDP-N-acetylmuramate dehydrogenase [Pseudomonadota bacterium]
MNLHEEIIKRGFSGRVTPQAPLAGCTTYRIGGPAELLVEPAEESDVKIVLDMVSERDVPLYVLGGGSKLLAPDEGVRGIVMLTGDLLGKIEVRGDEVVARAGARNAKLAEALAEEGLAGMEWIYDIPGRVGGSLVQNAGMNENSISDHLVEVIFFRKGGELVRTAKDDLHFGYRSSSFKSWGDTVIVSARFRFTGRGEPADVRTRMEEIKGRRHGKFPVTMPTCGSVFKRPEGHYPGALIEQCGLGGTKIGGAEISTRHHNFIVNRENATAADIRALVDLICERVMEEKGVVMERELIYFEEIRFPTK